MSQRGVLDQIIGSILLATLFSGCASLGIRPDLPVFSLSPEVERACQEKSGSYSEECLARMQFDTIVDWSNQLEESYRSRASLNEWSIYFAGTIALATVSTSAALAIAHTAQETLALVPVAGGFSSAFFGFLDNKSRAAAYTVAANEIAKARAQAIAKITSAQAEKAASRPPDAVQQSAVLAAYHAQAGELYRNVTEAMNTLETTRKEQLASAAEGRVAELTKRVTKLEEELPRLTLQNLLITRISPSTASKSLPVTITAINLPIVPNRDLSVVVGNTSPVPVTQVTYKDADQSADISFNAPEEPSPRNSNGYDVVLRVRNVPVRSLPDLRLHYRE